MHGISGNRGVVQCASQRVTQISVTWGHVIPPLLCIPSHHPLPSYHRSVGSIDRIMYTQAPMWEDPPFCFPEYGTHYKTWGPKMTADAEAPSHQQHGEHMVKSWLHAWCTADVMAYKLVTPACISDTREIVYILPY